MKSNNSWRFSILAPLLLLILLFGAVPQERVVLAQQGGRPDVQALLQRAQSKGSVRIIIGLDVAFRPEGELADQRSILDQQAAIARGQDALLQLLATRNVSDVVRFRHLPYLAMEVDAAALTDLAASPLVRSIEEDKIQPATLEDTIPLIHADQVAASGYTGTGWTVAILDTGVDSAHPFLAGRIVSEACYSTTSAANNATTVCPDGSGSQIGVGAGVNCNLVVYGCDHGTHVAGIAAGQGDDFSGVAPDADIIAIQVFSRFDDDADDTPCDDSDLPSPCALTFRSDYMQGLERVFDLRNDFDIASANMSLGGGEFMAACDTESPAITDAVDNLRSVDIATVVASGNDGYINAISFPACISSAISVGSTTKADDVSNFSNSATFLDLLAPGSSVESSLPGGGFGFKSGTSMATPHVTGAWAVVKTKFPTYDVSQVLTFLDTNGVSITDSRNNITKPRIDLAALIPTADADGPYTVNEGGAVILSGSGADPDGEPVTFAWDFDGDNVFADGAGPTPTFDLTGQDGLYPVTLRVSDPGGDFNLAETTVTVNNVAPNISFGSDAPQEEGTPVTLSGMVTDPGWLDLLTATIDWGDGEPIEMVGGDLENVQPDATLTFNSAHVYADNGDYTIEVCGSDDDTTTCQTAIVQIVNAPPTVTAIPDQFIYEGDPFDLELASFTDPGVLDTHTATIDWGDGSPLEAGTIVEAGGAGTVSGSHTYSSVDSYTITVTVTDNDGGVGSDTFELKVVYGFLKYCLFAQSNITLQQETTINCAVGSTGEVTLKPQASVIGDILSLGEQIMFEPETSAQGIVQGALDVRLMPHVLVQGDITAGRDVEVLRYTTVEGSITAGGVAFIGNPTNVTGDIQDGVSLPALAPITPVTLSLTAGGADLRTEQNQTLTLAPGVYGALQVGRGSTLNLSSGQYTFQRFEMFRPSETNPAIINLDLSGGPVIIDVVDDLLLGSAVQMVVSGGSEADILWRIQGSDVQLRNGGQFLGTFLAPNAQAELAYDANLSGALYGSRVVINSRATVSGSPAVAVLVSLYLP